MELKSIPPKDLDNYRREENLIIIDLRDRKDYQRHHISGAVNYPFDLLDANPYLLKKHQGYLLYCERGTQSFQMTRKLCMLGYHVLNLYGGINAYDSYMRNFPIR